MDHSDNQEASNRQPAKVPSTCYDDLFLPAAIIKLIVKVAKIFEMSSVDEFSILETLHSAILKNTEALEGNLDEKVIGIILLNIIRITDKYNKAGSAISQAKLESFFAASGITAKELNQHELSVYKSINFEVLQSATVEFLFKLIATHLAEQDNKPFLFEIALDVLRAVYLNAAEIYAEFTRDQDAVVTQELKQDNPLLAAAVFMVLMKLLNVSDRVHNQKFDATVGMLQHPRAAALLNQLAAVIYKFILPQ